MIRKKLKFKPADKPWGQFPRDGAPQHSGDSILWLYIFFIVLYFMNLSKGNIIFTILHVQYKPNKVCWIIVGDLVALFWRCALSETFWRISLYVTGDAIAKLYVTSTNCTKLLLPEISRHRFSTQLLLTKFYY